MRSVGRELAKVDKALTAVAERRSELLYGGLMYGDNDASLLDDWLALVDEADELLDTRLRLMAGHAT